MTPRGGLPGRTVVRPALRGLMARVLRRRLATGVMLADFRLGVGGGISGESGARDHMGRQTKASALAICAALQLSLSRRSPRSRTPSQQPVALFRRTRMTDAQAVTQQTIDSLSASGQEAGLQVAAYLQGEPVVNACADWPTPSPALRSRSRPVQQLVHRQGLDLDRRTRTRRARAPRLRHADRRLLARVPRPRQADRHPRPRTHALRRKPGDERARSRIWKPCAAVHPSDLLSQHTLVREPANPSFSITPAI